MVSWPVRSRGASVPELAHQGGGDAEGDLQQAGEFGDGPRGAAQIEEIPVGTARRGKPGRFRADLDLGVEPDVARGRVGDPATGRRPRPGPAAVRQPHGHGLLPSGAAVCRWSASKTIASCCVSRVTSYPTRWRSA
jgi:hypothetical protein